MASRWDPDEAARAADKLLELSKPNRAVLEARLAAGFFDGLKVDADITRARGDVAASRSTKKAATVNQDDAVAKGATLASSIREVVRRGAPKDKVLWKAFGVGARLSPTVGSVSSALKGILNAANTMPSQAQAVGLLAADVAKVQAYLDAITEGDTDQETKKVTSKQATAQLKAAVERLAQNLTHLASIARLALPADVADAFDAALPSSPKAKQKVAPS